MPKAIWNGAVIADAPESDIEVIEGNVYFPMQAVNQAYLQTSDKMTHCPWKGDANYFHVAVGEDVNKDAAWIYRAPLQAAKNITGRVAFWRGVEVQ